MACRIHLSSLLWWFFVFITELWTLQCRSGYKHCVSMCVFVWVCVAVNNIIRISQLFLLSMSMLAFSIYHKCFHGCKQLEKLWIGDCYAIVIDNNGSRQWDAEDQICFGKMFLHTNTHLYQKRAGSNWNQKKLKTTPWFLQRVTGTCTIHTFIYIYKFMLFYHTAQYSIKAKSVRLIPNDFIFLKILPSNIICSSCSTSVRCTCCVLFLLFIYVLISLLY